ncbi:MAG: barstar family protein [Alphaproteobacteria bacterium]
MTQPDIDPKKTDGKPVTFCKLDGVYETDTLLYQHIYKSIGAPEWAGYNLDALYDVLTGLVNGPIQIVWTNFGHIEKEQIDINLTVATLIEEAAQERPDLNFIKNT